MRACFTSAMHTTHWTNAIDAYYGFAAVQLDASRQAALGKQAELGDDELVELWWGQRGAPCSLAAGTLHARQSCRPVTHLLGAQLHSVYIYSLQRKHGDK